MRFGQFSFGLIKIDGVAYDHDVVIEGGHIRARKKKRSKKFRDAYGHTPLSVEEDIPWDCRRLVIGTGAYGSLPVMPQLEREAERRRVELVAMPTEVALKALSDDDRETNAILHVTC